MTIEHKNITNVELHETKGVSAATTNQTLHASSGTGVWKFQEFALNLDIVDITTNADYYIPIPYTGTITTISSAIDGAFSTADCNITGSIAGVAITNGALTITQSGSAAGDVDSATPSAANTASAGSTIKLAVTGSNTGATRCHITVIIRRTA